MNQKNEALRIAALLAEFSFVASMALFQIAILMNTALKPWETFGWSGGLWLVVCVTFLIAYICFVEESKEKEKKEHG